MLLVKTSLAIELYLKELLLVHDLYGEELDKEAEDIAEQRVRDQGRQISINRRLEIVSEVFEAYGYEIIFKE